MEEKIKEYLKQYLKDHPGYKANEKLFAERNNGGDRLLAGTQSVLGVFQQIAEAHNYKINLEIIEETDLQIQLTSVTGSIYSTYVFKKALIPE